MTKEQINEFTLRTSQANQSGLILILCDIIKVYATDATMAYENNDVDEYLSQMENAKRALNELISAFNLRDDLGRKVVRILRFIYGKMVSSTVKRTPCEIDRCMGMLDKLRISFEHLHEIDDEDAVMQNTHQVYAGLTYGKGILNESVDNNVMGNRGFYA